LPIVRQEMLGRKRMTALHTCLHQGAHDRLASIVVVCRDRQSDRKVQSSHTNTIERLGKLAGNIGARKALKRGGRGRFALPQKRENRGLCTVYVPWRNDPDIRKGS